ncbi:Fumarate hydratase class I, aerobic [Clostridiaceae bacterium JG1575]|nr:Fumarate hydratase class I, aerobic [Clostridiaceae bacterium JG1575]
MEEQKTAQDNVRRLTTPLTQEVIETLHAGDVVLLSGVIYTGRDAAHLRMVESLRANEPLPFDPQGQVIYYVGPTPEKPGQIFGSAGPTTSYRMDAYAPTLLDLGLKGMIGKGIRSKEVTESIVRNGAVYFGAIGGLGAIIGKSVRKSEIIAYEDLGPEAVRRLEVVDLPVTVLTDCRGNDLYAKGQESYLKWRNEHEAQ